MGSLSLHPYLSISLGSSVLADTTNVNQPARARNPAPTEKPSLPHSPPLSRPSTPFPKSKTLSRVSFRNKSLAALGGKPISSMFSLPRRTSPALSKLKSKPSVKLSTVPIAAVPDESALIPALITERPPSLLPALGLLDGPRSSSPIPVQVADVHVNSIPFPSEPTESSTQPSSDPSKVDAIVVYEAPPAALLPPAEVRDGIPALWRRKSTSSLTDAYMHSRNESQVPVSLARPSRPALLPRCLSFDEATSEVLLRSCQVQPKKSYARIAQYPSDTDDARAPSAARRAKKPKRTKKQIAEMTWLLIVHRTISHHLACSAADPVPDADTMMLDPALRENADGARLQDRLYLERLGARLECMGYNLDAQTPLAQDRRGLNLLGTTSPTSASHEDVEMSDSETEVDGQAILAPPADIAPPVTSPEVSSVSMDAESPAGAAVDPPSTGMFPLPPSPVIGQRPTVPSAESQLLATSGVPELGHLVATATLRFRERMASRRKGLYHNLLADDREDDRPPPKGAGRWVPKTPSGLGSGSLSIEEPVMIEQVEHMEVDIADA